MRLELVTHAGISLPSGSANTTQGRRVVALVRSADADRCGRRAWVLAESLARRGRRAAPPRDPAIGFRARNRPRRAPRGRARDLRRWRRWSCCAIRARCSCSGTPTGTDAISWVERIDPVTLDGRAAFTRSARWQDLAGRHRRAHERLAVRRVRAARPPAHPRPAARRDPRPAPRPSVQQLRDPAGRRHRARRTSPARCPAGPRTTPARPSELLVLEPDALEIVARLQLPEASIARLSADGDHDLRGRRRAPVPHRARTARTLALDDAFRPRYRTIAGQTYGWDAVLTDGAAWFLDNGAGSEGYAGTFVGRGVSAAPLHLVRVDLASGAVGLTEICGLPNGIVANPPAIDVSRSIAVGYDSANGVLAAFDFDTEGNTAPRWTSNAEPRVPPDPVPGHGRTRDGGPRRRAHDRPDRRSRHRDRDRAGARRYRQPAAVGRLPRAGLRA